MGGLKVSWRHIYVVSIVLRFIIGLSDSYIHPDEHFQVFEVLASKFFNYSTSIPWEFTSDQPARSLGPLYLFYGPLLGFLKLFNVNLTPISIWYLSRLQLIVMSWIITDMCLYRILPTKPERIKAIFFTLTSYITMVYQSHTFSNSLETPLLLICIMIIGDLRFDQEVRDVTKPDYEKLFYLGLVGAIGVFNRVTFSAFLLVPCYFICRYIWRFKSGLPVLIIGALVPTISFVLIDTYEFTGLIRFLSFCDFVITPLNNVVYNTNYKNLSSHGIHPWYTHILINLPQILGPLLIVMFYGLKNSYYKTVPFLSFVSGLLILSLVPHQELRFLTPLLPVACCCLDFRSIQGTEVEKEDIKAKIALNEKNKVPERVVALSSGFASFIIFFWYVFNIIMGILMGIFHQGGVIPALDYSHKNLLPNDQGFVQVWWRTYSPPLWMLGDTKHSTNLVTLDTFDTMKAKESKHLIIDAMGSEPQQINDIVNKIKSWNKPIMIVAPIASMNCDFDSDSYKLIWKHSQHIDLDHLNFSSAKCFAPGLGIYELL